MLLDIKNRLVIKGLMPENENFITMSLVNDILSKIEFSAAEREEYHLRVEHDGKTDQILWGDPNATTPKTFDPVEIDFSSAETALLKDRAKHFDTEKLVNQDNFNLIKMINDL